MRSLRSCLRLVFTFALLGWAIATPGFGQGSTTSALGGFVHTKDGAPVAGATVTAVHDESGTTSTTTTRPNGQYDLTGLRPGGPYTVSIKTADGTTDT